RDWSVTGVQTCALPISLAEVPTLLLGAFGVSEISSPFGPRDRCERFDLLTGTGRRAVKFEEQRRHFGEGQVRMRIAGSDLHRVEIGRASCRERGWIAGG